MFIEVPSILFVIFLLATSLLIIKIIEKKTNINGELKRKLFHVTMGLVMLIFPYIFTSIWSVGILGILSLIILFALKHTKLNKSLGTVLYSVSRESVRRNIFCNICIYNFLSIKRR